MAHLPLPHHPLARPGARLCASAALLLLSGCGREPALSPSLGQSCTVQIRRDALGAAAPNGIPPMTGAMNGAETSISGRLEQLDDGWVVLRASGKLVWIARDAVLLLELPGAPPGGG